MPPNRARGGKGIFIALVPWIIFTVLASYDTLKIGSIAALVAAVVIAVPGIRAGRPKLLGGRDVHRIRRAGGCGRRVDGTLGRSVRAWDCGVDPRADLARLLDVHAVHREYVRDRVPEQYWGSPKFKEINRKLTLMWACMLAAMVPFHIIAGTVDTRLGNIIFNWAIPLGLVYWGIKRSSAASDSDTAPVQTVA